MARRTRRNIWEQLLESTEGPTVSVTIPRAFAEELLRSLASSLEQEVSDGDDEDDEGDGEDLDSVADLNFDDDHDEPDEDDMGGPPDFDGDDLDLSPAGDDDDDEDDEDDDKKEAAGEYRPQTALGESTFSLLNRNLSSRKRKR